MIIKLSKEQLKKINGGSDEPDAEKIKEWKIQNEKAAKIPREAAIYRKGARGNFDGVHTDMSYWCNMNTLDTLEAVGFHTEWLESSKGKYDTTSNQIIDNANKFIQEFSAPKAAEAVNSAVKENSNLSYANAVNLYNNVVNDCDCPLGKMKTGKEAHDLANKGYMPFIGKKEDEHGHAVPVLPSDVPYDETKGPLVSHVGGGDNGIKFAATSFGFGLDSGWDDSRVEIFYDKTQTHIPKAGSRPAWDFKNNRQSMSIYDPLYKKEDFEIKLEIKSNSAGENNNSNQLTFFRLDPEFFIAARDGIDVNRLMHQIRQENQREAEAESKRIAEEKAAREKAEKERLEREKEDQKKKEAFDNSDSGSDSNDSDESTNESIDNDIDDHEDNDEGTVTTPPENTGDGNQTPPTDGNGESSASSNEDSSTGNGGGGGNNGGNESEPPSPPGGGSSGTIYTPCSLDTGNEYYLGSLYGTKPFSAQESSAFNSTIISNELSALQPITSLNVAGLPVNDTAIKEDPFGV